MKRRSLLYVGFNLFILGFISLTLTVHPALADKIGQGQCPYEYNAETGFVSGSPPVTIKLSSSVIAPKQPVTVTVQWAKFSIDYKRAYNMPGQYCHREDLHIFAVDYLGKIITNSRGQALDDWLTRCGSGNLDKDRTFTIDNIDVGPASNNIYQIILSPDGVPGYGPKDNFCYVGGPVPLTIDPSAQPPGKNKCDSGTADTNAKCIVRVQTETGDQRCKDLDLICKPGLSCISLLADPNAPGVCLPPDTSRSQICPAIGDKCTPSTDSTINPCNPDVCNGSNINLICNDKNVCATRVPQYAAFDWCKQQGDKTSSSYLCDTAIGQIATDLAGFVKSLFQFILGIAGMVAVGVIVYSGLLLLTSQGNAEKMQGAKETITAAIVGIVFIIFSMVILQAIGVDILGLPGFAK